MKNTHNTARIRTSTTLALLLCSVSSAALAQVNVPSQAQPGQYEQRFQTPTTTPRPLNDTSATPPATNQAAKIDSQFQKDFGHFTLKSVSVQGNTVYNDAALAPYYQPYIGKDIGLTEARTIATNITNHYRQAGYILTVALLPRTQNKGQGQLNVQVVEGYVSSVRFEGSAAEPNYRKLLQSYAKKIEASKPLNEADLERYLLLMNDLPGITARTRVVPSATVAGTGELIIQAERKKFFGSLQVDNRGSKYLGPYEAIGTVGANSVLGLEDKTTFRYVTAAPQSELRFYDLQHSQFIDSEGTKLTLGGSHSVSKPGFNVKLLDLRGSSTFLSALVEHPFIRDRQQNLVGRFAVDRRDSKNETRFFNFLLSEDEIAAARLSGSYDFADSWNGVNLVNLEFSKGMDAFGVSDRKSIQRRSRTDADVSFSKLRLDVNRTHYLPGNFSVFGAAAGQYSFSRLLSAEQFTLGGVNFGSAYDAAEISGDSGFGGKLELRYAFASGVPYFFNNQLFTYVDGGKVYTIDSPSRKDVRSLSSAGVGVRSAILPWLSGSFEVGVPISRDVAVRRDKDPRSFFSLVGSF